MIELKQIDGTIIDLSISPKFVEHYNKPGAFAKFILDNELNPSRWYSDFLRDLSEDAVIVDVGMNVGLFSLYLPAKQREFYCVEPSPYHIEVARELFDKLGYNASIWEGVIYNIDGSVLLFEEPQNTTSNRVGQDGRKRVNSLRLKTFFEKYGIDKVDLLKLDCEGSEREIILMDDIVGEALKKCKTIFIETHTGSVYMTLDECAALIEKVKSFGFTHIVGTRHDSHYFINDYK